jgi:hypothetical protein
MLDHYEYYATNWRESGLTPMTWQEWEDLGVLLREREALCKMLRARDIEDLY